MRSRQAGFTLIEIMVVMAIIATLAGAVMFAVMKAVDSNKKTQCMNNLRQMGTVMVANRAEKRWPRKSGAGFLLSLYFTEKRVKSDLKVFLCPGDETIAYEGGSAEHKALFDQLDPKLETWPDDITSYAGRLVKSAPLISTSEEQEAIACDRNGIDGNAPHHGDGLNVLFQDGKVEYLDTNDLGLGPDDVIIIGPGGPAVLEPLSFMGE